MVVDKRGKYTKIKSLATIKLHNAVTTDKYKRLPNYKNEEVKLIKCQK